MVRKMSGCAGGFRKYVYSNRPFNFADSLLVRDCMSSEVYVLEIVKLVNVAWDILHT